MRNPLRSGTGPQAYTIVLQLATIETRPVVLLGLATVDGFDTGNTLYNGTNSLGLTALNNITFNTGTSLANYATRMTITSAGNVSCTGSIGCTGISTSGGALIGTYMGIANSSPYLCCI